MTTIYSLASEDCDELNCFKLEAIEFVTVFRGKGIDGGHKSLTLKLRFRDEDKTLTHEEVDAPFAKVIDILCTSFGAEIRS